MRKQIIFLCALITSGNLSFGQTYSQSSDTVTQTGKTYYSTTSDLSAVKVTGGVLNLSGSRISSVGNSTSNDSSNLTGLNAVILATGSSDTAVINLSADTISSSGSGACGIFAYGKAKITSSGDKLNLTGDSANAIMCSGGGIIVVTNDTAVTEGSNSSIIATNISGGTITANGGSYTSNGNNSAAIYSTGTITCSDATLIANGAEALVIEGSNKITLNNCSVQCNYNKWGSLLTRSVSGHGFGANDSLTINGGSFTYTGTMGGMFYNTNCTAHYILKDVSLTNSCDTLISCINRNMGGFSGSRTGTAYLNVSNQILSGLIYADTLSKLYITLQDTSSFTGTINPGNIANSVSLIIDSTCSWNVTSDAYLNEFTDSAAILNDTVTNVTGNGFIVFYDMSIPANGYLKNKTYLLKNNGYLKPFIKPLKVTKVFASSSANIKIIFNEPVDSSSENISNYYGLGTISAATRSANLDTVTLSLTNSLVMGNSYTLSIAHIKDTSGTRTLDSSSYNIIYNNSIANIVITEIMYMFNNTGGPTTPAGDSLQYIELYNNSEDGANVSGYIIEHKNRNTLSELYQFSAGTILAAKSYTVCAKNAKAVENYFGISNVYQWNAGQSLSSFSDQLGLFNAAGNIIDTCAFGMTATMPPYTILYSTVLCDAALDNLISSNWSDATDSVGNINGVLIYGNPGKGCTADTSTHVTISAVNGTLMMCYPNPVKSVLYIKANSPALQKLRIYNVYGILVYESILSKTKTIDISNWTNGIYLIKAGSASKRIVIAH